MIRIPCGRLGYCDATPVGDYAALVADAHIQTNRGRVPLPGQNLLFLRIHPAGIRFAGIGHQDDRAWEWDGSSWQDRGIAFGPRAVTYAPDGTLHIIRSAPAAPTFVDRERQIWEYTILGDLWIGQGGDGPHGEDPCIALLNGRRHLIEAGQCRFINAKEFGDLVSIAYVREDTREAVIRWLTRAEIAALPIAGVKVPTQGPPPPPTRPPIPPDPKPMDNKLHVVQTVRADYPTPLGSRHWEFLVELAQTLGAKLFRKDGGSNVRIPALNLSVSQDIVILDGFWIDVLGDAENEAVPVWAAHPNAGEPEKWIDVSQVELPGEPPSPPRQPDVPPPAPPRPSVDLAAVLARIDLSDARAAAAQAETNETLKRIAATLDVLRDRQPPAPVVKFPTYRNRIIGTLEPQR